MNFLDLLSYRTERPNSPLIPNVDEVDTEASLLQQALANTVENRFMLPEAFMTPKQKVELSEQARPKTEDLIKKALENTQASILNETSEPKTVTALRQAFEEYQDPKILNNSVSSTSPFAWEKPINYIKQNTFNDARRSYYNYGLGKAIELHPEYEKDLMREASAMEGLRQPDLYLALNAVAAGSAWKGLKDLTSLVKSAAPTYNVLRNYWKVLGKSPKVVNAFKTQAKNYAKNFGKTFFDLFTRAGVASTPIVQEAVEENRKYEKDNSLTKKDGKNIHERLNKSNTKFEYDPRDFSQIASDYYQNIIDNATNDFSTVDTDSDSIKAQLAYDQALAQAKTQDPKVLESAAGNLVKTTVDSTESDLLNQAKGETTLYENLKPVLEKLTQARSEARSEALRNPLFWLSTAINTVFGLPRGVNPWGVAQENLASYADEDPRVQALKEQAKVLGADSLTQQQAISNQFQLLKFAADYKQQETRNQILAQNAQTEEEKLRYQKEADKAKLNQQKLLTLAGLETKEKIADKYTQSKNTKQQTPAQAYANLLQKYGPKVANGYLNQSVKQGVMTPEQAAAIQAQYK